MFSPPFRDFECEPIKLSNVASTAAKFLLLWLVFCVAKEECGLFVYNRDQGLWVSARTLRRYCVVAVDDDDDDDIVWNSSSRSLRHTDVLALAEPQKCILQTETGYIGRRQCTANSPAPPPCQSPDWFHPSSWDLSNAVKIAASASTWMSFF